MRLGFDGPSLNRQAFAAVVCEAPCPDVPIGNKRTIALRARRISQGVNLQRVLMHPPDCMRQSVAGSPQEKHAACLQLMAPAISLLDLLRTT